MANRRIGEKLDPLHTLAQFVENHRPAVEKRAPVLGRFDTLPATIQQPSANRMLQLRDRSGNGGLGGIEALRCLSHAARFHHDHENVKVVQLEAASNTGSPLHLSCIPIWISPDQQVALCGYHGIHYLRRCGSPRELAKWSRP